MSGVGNGPSSFNANSLWSLELHDSYFADPRIKQSIVKCSEEHRYQSWCFCCVDE